MKLVFILAILVSVAVGTLFPTAQKNQIISQHNTFRSQIARGLYKSKAGVNFAKAANMQRMIWNGTLASQSSAYANKCLGLVHSGASGVGENLYIVWGGSLTNLGATASKSWANEFYTYGPKGYKFSMQTGHATAMAWATTRTVGCGYAYCAKDKSYLVEFSGNVGTQQAYIQGAPCSKCPTGMTCKTGLCS